MMRGYGYGLGRGLGVHAFAPGFGIAGALFGLLVLAAIVMLVIMLVRHKGPGVHAAHMAPYAPSTQAAPAAPAQADPYAAALATAANRLASGEITKKQYEEIRATLYGEPKAQ